MSYGILSSPSHAHMMPMPTSTPRSSSPLNPHTNPNNHESYHNQHHPSSSSPMTSPTPMYSNLQAPGAGEGAGASHLHSFPFPSLATTASAFAKASAGPSYRHMYATTTNSQRIKSKNPTSSNSTISPISQPRYSAQRSKRYSVPAASSSSPSSSSRTHPEDLFSEASTPTESLLWRERFSRRAEERERRRQARDADLDRRRGVVNSGPEKGRGDGFGQARGNGPNLTPEEEEEADRRAQADDEEIFRRLVVLQRTRAHRAALVSHEQEVGDSNALDVQPFWDEEEEEELLRHLQHRAHPNSNGNAYNGYMQSNPSAQDALTPSTSRTGGQWTEMRNNGCNDNDEDEMERWEREAAEAERAEQAAEVEEAALAEQVERAYHLSQYQKQHHDGIDGDSNFQKQGQWSQEMGMDVDMGMAMGTGIDTDLDWAAMDTMDIE
ncbi:hypothetical protein IAU59_005202 [Kwoniella sp. CBS 9459]